MGAAFTNKRAQRALSMLMFIYKYNGVQRLLFLGQKKQIMLK